MPFAEERRFFASKGAQLVEGVEGEEGDAGLAEDLLARDARGDLVKHAFGASVAVMHRQPEQAAIGVKDAEIHPPGIHADGGDGAAGRLARFPQPLDDLVEQREDIPVEGCAEPDRTIREAMADLDVHLAAIEMPDADAPALGAKIDGSYYYLLMHGGSFYKVSGFKFQVSGFRFQVSGFRFQVSSFRFQVSGFRFQVSSFKFQVSSFKFQVSS